MATDLQAMIENAVRIALAPTPVDVVEVEARPDHADEDALFITATLPPGTPLIGGRRYSAAMIGVSDALLAIGDRRFPYLRLNRAGEDAVEEAEPSHSDQP